MVVLGSKMPLGLAPGLAVSEKMSFEAVVDDARRTLGDGNSSPWAYGSGELTMHYYLLECIVSSPEPLARVS